MVIQSEKWYEKREGSENDPQRLRKVFQPLSALTYCLQNISPALL